ncbi:MAG TPA: LLM class flavin-dependent oxidoreductase, partial [Candidatus Binataceae bacterium]|nr:LLM class flavin-dependent oxidoreductase [Candidatus Binataceae bacterium]
MEFGTLIFPKPDRVARDVAFAESHGFTHAWIPDSHMIWGDTYACMALAAVATRKIKLATGVAIASNRIPPVTAHAIATINQLAPGRTILGFGTGHTGRRVMGLDPVKQTDFREQVRELRDLLTRGETDYRTEGVTRHIR